jgi:tetratricopeptide (TPR) repeat protein
VALAPNDVELHLSLGRSELAAGDFPGAVAAYGEVLRRDPKNLPALLSRAVAYEAQGQHAAAIADTDAAVRLSPHSAEALNGRCWARAMAGAQLDAALADCDAAIALKPEAPEAWDSRGLVRLRRSEAQPALADYSQALALNPRSASALYGRGLARLRLGQAADAQADMAAAQALDPKVAANYARYGLKP